MTPAPTLSPELIRQSLALARALAAAARTWALYPADHPAVGSALTRLGDTLRETTAGAGFAFAVTPRTLLVAGVPLPDDAPVVETARLLHDHDILQVTFLGDVPPAALQALLALLARSTDDLRQSGGPAPAWTAAGHPSIAIEQIDYEEILKDKEVAAPPDRRDDVWTSIVNVILQGEQQFDPAQQARLLEISRSALDIRELAGDVIAPKCTIDGSPLITTQAATVLAVFRHLASIVTVVEPDRLPEVMRNVAAATAGLDPHVVLQMMQMDEAVQETPMVARLSAAFDDQQVAQLLATALARDERATARLAQVFDTIAPDEPRKRRVLTMAKSMLSEHDFGKSGQFRAVWASMETLLLSYDERPYVSGGYQASLEGAAARGEMLAARELPPELPEWIASLEQDNVRGLSVLLITDLLRLEEDAARAAELTKDMGVLLEDLFLAGDFASALIVVQELQRASGGPVAGAAARATLTAAADSPSLREAAAALGELDHHALQAFADTCSAIGPSATRALYPALQSEDDTLTAQRARTIVGRFGAAAALHLAALTDDRRWFVQRNAAQLLGATRSAEAVPPLQSLLRKGEPRVLRHAVAALAGIDDPAAARAIQTALRAATGDRRAAMIDALVAGRDPRVVPMLVRILDDVDPFGPDLPVLLATLAAVQQLADDRAVGPVRRLMYRKRLFGGRKARAFKTASVEALVSIGTAAANTALDDAARTGDRLLKRLVKELRR
jgi:hypothetical protein